MVSAFRVCVVGLPLLLSIASIVLAALAIAGQTTKSNPISNIYMFKLNLTEATSVFSTDGVSTLSDVYTFGMWGYCKGSSDSSGDYSVTSCSKPKAMYLFNPLDTLETELGSASITLPDDISNYIKTAEIVSKLIFVTGIIGAAAAFLTGVFTILSFHSHIMSCLAMIIGVISFLATVICAAASTGMFSIISKYFNDAFDTYGLTGNLGDKWFYAFIWASAGCALITAFLNFWAICCGSTSKSRSFDHEPVMEYHEKYHSSDSE